MIIAAKDKKKKKTTIYNLQMYRAPTILLLFVLQMCTSTIRMIFRLWVKCGMCCLYVIFIFERLTKFLTRNKRLNWKTNNNYVTLVPRIWIILIFRKLRIHKQQKNIQKNYMN